MLPTGRNLYTTDPRAVPSRAAHAQGVKLAVVTGKSRNTAAASSIIAAAANAFRHITNHSDAEQCGTDHGAAVFRSRQEKCVTNTDVASINADLMATMINGTGLEYDHFLASG